MRTVAVELLAKVGAYKRGMGEAKSATKDVDEAITDVGKNDGLNRAGESARRFGRSTSEARARAKSDLAEVTRQAADLDRQIKLTESGIRSLARSYAASGDPKILKLIRADQRQLSGLRNVRSLLPDPSQLAKIGSEAGTTMAAGMGGAMKIAANPIGLAVGGTLAAAAAPAIGATIAGAIMGGAGIGGVIGGLTIAAKDARVQAAAKSFSQRVLGNLQSAALPFVDATMRGLGIVEQGLAKVDGSIRRIFRNSASFVDPLASGLMEMLQPIIVGLDAVIAKAGPVITAIRSGMRQVGEAIGGMFKSLEDNGYEAAIAIELVFQTIANTIKVTGAAINGLTELFGWLFDMVFKFSFVSDETKAKMDAFRASTEQASGAGKDAGSSFGSFSAVLKDTGKVATTVEHEFQSLEQRLNAMVDRNLSAAEANIALRESIKSAADAVDKKAGVSDKEASALLSMARSANTATAALDEQGRTVDQATAAHEANRRKLIETAVRMGYTRAEAKSLASQYLATPKGVATAITQPGMSTSRKQVREYDKEIASVARSIKTNVSVHGDAAAYDRLKKLLVQQEALSKGISVSAASSAFRKQEANAFHAGGWTGPGAKMQPAGVVHADEFVIRKESRQRIERQHPGLLAEMNATGQVGGYAAGGRVINAPFRVNASITKIMTLAQALSKVAPKFGDWPSGPGAQRGDSGVWRKVVQLIKSGPKQGSFGNAYRPGDPLWHGCVPMDTRILTRRGWITHDEVLIGQDETIGYNAATGKNEWTLIVGLQRYEDAELWKLENSQFSAEVTPGHKWLVDQQVTVQTETVCTECGREFATGRGMTKHRADVHKVLTPRRERFEEQLVETRDFKQSTRIHLAKPADLGEQLPITDDEAELIGWIFGDGYMEPYGPTIVQSKPEQVEYLRGFMARFDCSEYVRQPEGRQTHVIFRWKLSTAYWQDLSSRSKASKDDALNFVFSLSPSQREAFVRGFLSADGTRDPRTATEGLGYAAFQVSGPVAEAIKVAAYLEGYRPDTRVKTEFDKDRFGTQPMEHIGFRRSIVKGRNLPMVATRTADVWCPTTTLGTWTARQGEEIFLTGNSGRAVDWMGFNMDALASFLAAKKPLELIHRTNQRDYAYTRGRNMGSFDAGTMNAHRNHIHIAMADGGVIPEPVWGVGASGRTYSFAERGPERVLTAAQTAAGAGGGITVQLVVNGPVGSQSQLEDWLVAATQKAKSRGRL